MQTLKWGIIGCGNIASDFVHALRNSPYDHRVIAAGARSLQKAEEFAERVHLRLQPYGSYEDVLNDEDVDIVYIAVLNCAHAELTIKALEAGKHVLCEKPMAVNAKEVRRMIEKAREKKLFLMEAMWSRFMPSWTHIRQIVQSEELGKATHFHLNIAGRNPRFNLPTCEVPTLSTGVYCVSLAFFLFGESPVRIHAVGEKNEEGFEEWCNLSLVFENGKHATLYFGRACLSAWTAYIACTTGQIQVHNFCWAPTEFTKINGPIRVGATKSETFEYPLPDDHSKYFFNHSQGLVYEADHVFEMLQKGRTESEIMPLDTSLKIAGVLDEIRRQLDVRFPQDDERHS